MARTEDTEGTEVFGGGDGSRSVWSRLLRQGLAPSLFRLVSSVTYLRAFSCLIFRSAAVNEFGGESEQERRRSKAADAPPTGDVPAPCAEVRTKAAADEVAEHVNHVEPTA